VSALLLLAARKTGILKQMNEEARSEDFIHLYLQYMRYWEDESADIKKAQHLIEALNSEITT
jgi:hypothetical protein